jgi:hypothetical protein
VLQTIAPSAKPRQSFLERRFQQVRELGGRLLTSNWVIRVVVLYFAVRALSVLGGAALVAITAVGAGRVPPPYSLVTIAVAVLASCLGLIAVVTFARSRLTGLRWFLRSVLVSIFMVDALAFYEHALAALASLALDILLYAMLTALLRREGPGSSERRVAERVGQGRVFGQATPRDRRAESLAAEA